MTTKKAIIEVSSLRKSWGDVEVLRGVDFTVRPGQVFALLGSNGAGKTTTVKILATLLKPGGGSVRVCGFDAIQEPRRVRECISLTGQYAAVDEVLTGRENMYMIGSLRHSPGFRRQADAFLAQFELSDAADRRVATYSGGMRRKLDLAMSLMGNPSVIFLDEPTTGLDPQSRLSMWKTIKELSQSGTTIFLTTQYLEEAERLADYIAILNQGVITAEGTAEELKKRLPGGKIEFSFAHESDWQQALAALQGYPVQANGDMLSLSVMTDDGIESVTDILNRLKAGAVSVSRFEQKLPSLEEVFLTLIGKTEQKGEGNEHDED